MTKLSRWLHLQGIGVEWMSMKKFLAEMVLEKCSRDAKQTFKCLRYIYCSLVIQALKVCFVLMHVKYSYIYIQI
jgi:hypothetical protein